MANLKVSLENIIPLTEARDHFSQIVNEVLRDKLYILTKGGKPAVAVIDVRYLESLTGGSINSVNIEKEISKDPSRVGRTPMIPVANSQQNQPSAPSFNQNKPTPPIPPTFNSIPKPVFTPSNQNSASSTNNQATNIPPKINFQPVSPKPVTLTPSPSSSSSTPPATPIPNPISVPTPTPAPQSKPWTPPASNPIPTPVAIPAPTPSPVSTPTLPTPTPTEKPAWAPAPPATSQPTPAPVNPAPTPIPPTPPTPMPAPVAPTPVTPDNSINISTPNPMGQTQPQPVSSPITIDSNPTNTQSNTPMPAAPIISGSGLTSSPTIPNNNSGSSIDVIQTPEDTQFNSGQKNPTPAGGNDDLDDMALD